MSRACALCWQTKKKCDRKRPCKRCVTFDHVCAEREVAYPRYRGKYTRNVCLGCTTAKTRCGENRPCSRCKRLGITCQLPLALTDTLLSPYSSGGYLPTPSTEGIFQNFLAFLSTVSPFALSDLLSGSEMGFLSALGGMTSVIPFARRREFLGRIVTLAELQQSRPHLISFISNRVQMFLEPEQSTPLIVPENSYSYNDLVTLEHTKAVIEYYLNNHEFEEFPMETGQRPGVMVVAFLDPDQVDASNHVLLGTLNSEAENLTGYTSDEYNAFQNVITADFSNFGGFPQVLRVFHKDDIHIHIAKGMIAFLSPYTEIPFQARLIHKNGHVIPARMVTIATVKPNGGMRLFITAAAPLTCV